MLHDRYADDWNVPFDASLLIAAYVNTVVLPIVDSFPTLKDGP
jgi:hypothetical protein